MLITLMHSSEYHTDKPYKTAKVYRDLSGYFVELCEDGSSIEQVFPDPDTQDEAERIAYEWTKPKT